MDNISNCVKWYCTETRPERHLQTDVFHIKKQKTALLPNRVSASIQTATFACGVAVRSSIGTVIRSFAHSPIRPFAVATSSTTLPHARTHDNKCLGVLLDLRSLRRARAVWDHCHHLHQVPRDSCHDRPLIRILPRAHSLQYITQTAPAAKRETMRYPLSKNLFPALTLTEGQEEQYERLAHSLVKETVADYDHFWAQDRRVVDVARWKPIKKRDNIVVYKHRALQHGGHDASVVTRGSSRGAVAWNNVNSSSSNPAYADLRESEAVNPLAQTIGLTSSAFSITERSLQPERANLPKLLAVGSIKGTLDDVMYGIASPNAASMRLKTSYVDDEIVDGAVLYQMKGPSPAEPFRFLGIKWLVKENQGAVKKFIRPRDFVILEYSSVMMRPSGDRIGFHLMHSIEIPTCRELADKNILRAKVSSCYLYRELPNGFVDLYMTAKVEPRGKVLESMAIRAAATALSSCWKSVACAHNKKLAWLLQNDQKASFSASNNFRSSSRGANNNGGGFATQESFRDTAMSASLAKKGCGVCRRSFGTFSKSSTCQLCYEQMCNRCRVYKKLSSETLDTMITKTAMVFCKKCIDSVSDESSAEIAKQEIWDGRYRSRTRASSSATYATRSSYANPSLYEGRLSERSNYSAIFNDKDDDNVSVGRTSALSSASRMSSRRRNTSSPQNRRSSVKKISWQVNGGDDDGPGSFRGTAATDALTLMDLDPTENDDARTSSSRSRSPARKFEPILLLNEPVTCVSMREMDYIAPPAEGDHDGDEFESVTTSSVYQESDDGRMSYTSSIALMDEDGDDDVDNHQVFYHPSLSEFPVVEGDEDEESTDETEAENERALVVRSTASNQFVDHERITEVHAVVKAQSELYDRDSTPSSLQGDDDTLGLPYPRKQSYQMQLWMQMNDLRDTAENTYQVAKRNTETLLSQGGLDSESSRKLRSFSQPFQFNVVGLRAGRSMTVAASQENK